MMKSLCMCCGKQIDAGRKYKLLNGFVTCVGHTFEFTVPLAEGTSKSAATANNRSKEDGERRRTDGANRTRRESR